MNDFIQERMRVESDASALFAMDEARRSQVIERIQKEAEEKSQFKKWQLVRVCRPGALHLADWSTDERPESDPYKYFDSRVMGWDMFGRIDVATEIGDNPHCSECCWGEDKVAPREGKDWFAISRFKIGQEISYIWELVGFWENEALGKKVPAVLVGPHIELGDWLVSYKKPSGGWITRVLNEKQMLPR